MTADEKRAVVAAIAHAELLLLGVKTRLDAEYDDYYAAPSMVNYLGQNLTELLADIRTATGYANAIRTDEEE